MRARLSLVTLALGIALAALSYFALAAPIGPPTSPVYSSPRLPGAPTLFIAGVMLAFLSAVVYELLPDE